MDKTLLQKLDAELPPFLCYMLARKKPRGRLAGPGIVSERSGIPYRSVQRIGSQISWATVRLDQAAKFIEACGFKISGCVIVQNKKNAYLRWCKEKAVRPFHHVGNAHWRLFNERSRQWMKMHKLDKGVGGAESIQETQRPPL